MERKKLLSYTVALLFVLQCCCATNDSPHTTAKELTYLNGPKVQRVEWSEDLGSIQDIVEENPLRPLVFRGTDVLAWTAMDVWNESYLSRFVTKKVGVKKRPRGIKFKPGCCEVHSMTLSEFFTEVKSQQSKADGDPSAEVLYVSSPLDSLGSMVARDILPVDFLKFKTTLYSQDDFIIQAWIGMKGAVTVLHHDYQHNLFTQISGRKKFTLFPPTDWRGLYMYPRFHFKHRQLRVDIDGGSSEMAEFPRFASTAGVEVVLEPGDLLFLPPMWYHQVEPLDDMSFSVNVWSPNDDIARMDTVWSQLLPSPPAHWTWSQRLDAHAYFVRQLTLAVFGDLTQSFIQDLVDSRFHRSGLEPAVAGVDYDEHDPDVASYLSYRESLKESTVLTKEFEDRSMTLASISLGCAARDTKWRTDTQHIAKVHAAAEKAAEPFLTTRDVGVREIYLGHFIEDLSAQLVGEHHIATFLRQCVVRYV